MAALCSHALHLRRVSKKHSSLMPSGAYIERMLFRKLFHSQTRGALPARTKDAVVMVFQLQMVTDAGVGHAVAAYRVGVIDSVFRCCMFIFSMLNYWECSTCRLIRFISHALSSGNFTLHESLHDYAGIFIPFLHRTCGFGDVNRSDKVIAKC